MNDFIDSYNRWRCVMFTVLASIITITALLLVYGGFSREMIVTAIVLISILATYFFVGRCSHVHQETRYLVRTIPVLFMIAITAGLVLTGFIVYVTGYEQPLRMTAGFSTLEDIPRIIILVFIVLGLLLPFFVVVAARDITKVLRAHHKVYERAITFFTKKREWTVNAEEYIGVVIGEEVVFACRREEDVEQAVSYINRPWQQSWTARPLDGTYFINTESLIKDAQTKGLRLEEVKRAVIARFS